MKLVEAWRRISDRPTGWYWIASRLRNGDLYHLLSLLPAFVKAHGCDYPVYLIVESEGRGDLPRLFGEYIDELVVEPDLDGDYDDWKAFFHETGLSTSGLDTPILLHPFYSQETFRVRNRAVSGMGVTPMEVYKHILHLYGETEPAPPALNPDLKAAARTLCEEARMPAGRSVLLFPYAHSLPVASLGHLEHLAAALVREGYAVFTSVAGSEAPVAGAAPITIPFALLPDVAEHAGWAIGARSGVGDVLSTVRCRKTWVFPNVFNLRIWALDALGLARDAHEFAFCFPLGSPEEFTEAVLSGRSSEGLSIRPRPMADAVGYWLGEHEKTTLSFRDVQRAPETVGETAGAAAARLAQSPSLVIVRDLVPAGHHRWRPLMTELLNEIVVRIGDLPVRFYACRDYLGLDFYEEIDAAALLGAYHRSAQFWHAVFIVCGEPLEHFLRPPMQERGPALGTVTSGQRVSFAAVYNSRSHHDFMISERPLHAGGFELSAGWDGPEPWGVWSLGRRATMRVAFDTPPSGGFRLHLAAMAAISESFPKLGLAVTVNGVPIGRSSLEFPSPALEILLDVPAEVARHARLFWFVIEFDEIRSPEQQGAAPDGRPLGIGLHSALVTHLP